MKKLLLVLCLIASASANADFAAHLDTSSDELTYCHRKYNDGQPIYVSIDWKSSLVQVNDVYTNINGTSGNGNGIQTTNFINNVGMRVQFAIMHIPGHPVVLVMQESKPYKIDADGYQYHKALDVVLLTCPQSFITPFKKRMYSSQY